MKRLVYGLAMSLVLLCSCGGGGRETEVETVDTMAVMVAQIRQCSRLYTAEYVVRKVVTHDDVLTVGGEILHRDFSVSLPLGKRKVAIPIDGTVKAYIDFADFGADNIRRDGGKIEVTLPDPKLVLTSTRIDHEGIRQYVPLTRSNFTDEELSLYEQQGRRAIIDDIAHTGIIETARQSAATTLIPMLGQMGFAEQDVTVTFRRDFGIRDIPMLIEKLKD